MRYQVQTVASTSTTSYSVSLKQSPDFVPGYYQLTQAAAVRLNLDHPMIQWWDVDPGADWVKSNVTIT